MFETKHGKSLVKCLGKKEETCEILSKTFEKRRRKKSLVTCLKKNIDGILVKHETFLVKLQRTGKILSKII